MMHVRSTNRLLTTCLLNTEYYVRHVPNVCKIYIWDTFSLSILDGFSMHYIEKVPSIKYTLYAYSGCTLALTTVKQWATRFDQEWVTDSFVVNKINK